MRIGPVRDEATRPLKTRLNAEDIRRYVEELRGDSIVPELAGAQRARVPYAPDFNAPGLDDPESGCRGPFSPRHAE